MWVALVTVIFILEKLKTRACLDHEAGRLSWRPGGFLENCWSSAHVRRLQKLVWDAVVDGGSNRVDALPREMPRQAGKIWTFSPQTKFYLCCPWKVVPTFGVSLPHQLTWWGKSLMGVLHGLPLSWLQIQSSWQLRLEITMHWFCFDIFGDSVWLDIPVWPQAVCIAKVAL